MAVRDYFHKGWTVFPIPDRQKAPAISWQEFQSRPNTEEEIAAYENLSNSNFAVVTGPVSRLVVIDIDDPSLAREYLNKYPTGRVCQTPRGGLHLYYTYPQDGKSYRNHQNLFDHVDVRGEGGYVLVPPSRVLYPADRYPDPALANKILPYSWLAEGDPAPLPDYWRNLILNAQRGSDISEQANGQDQRALLRAVLRDGFEPHKHNSQLFQLACYLIGAGTPLPVTMMLMSELDRRDPTPQGETQVEQTVKSAYKAVRERQQKQQENETGLPVRDLIDFLSNASSTEYLIHEWLPANSVIMISAHPEMFKTWLALDMAITVAMGNTIDPVGFCGC